MFQEFQEFTELLEMYTVLNESFIIAGDINIHVETDEPSSLRFHEIMDLFDLKQRISEPTHIMSHTIDVVITRNNDANIEDIRITRYNLSHHFLIGFVFNTKAKEVFMKTITYRKLKKVDNQKFSEDIKYILSSLPNTTKVEDKVKYYSAVTFDTVDKRALWFDAEYASLRRERRKAAKKFKRSGTSEDKERYKCLTKQTTALAQSKQKNYIKDKLDTDKSSKNLYTIVNNLLDNKVVSLPSPTSDTKLANDFSKYFSENVNKIRASIVVSTSKQLNSPSLPPKLIPIFEFEPATTDELKQILMTYGIKCSPDDPVPSFLLKENVNVFIPYWL